MTDSLIERPPSGSTLASADLDGVCIESLEPGTALNVRTVNSLYRIVVLDGPNHVVQIRGGTAFPDNVSVRIESATGSGSALKRGWIVVGFRMELFLGRLRIKSSPVLSVLNAPGQSIERCREGLTAIVGPEVN